MSEPRGPRYQCSHCKHIWIPRGVKPGDAVFCPACKEFHSKRADYLKPPKKVIHVPPGEPVKKKPRSRPLKPYQRKTYDHKSLDMRTRELKREKVR